MLIVTNKEKENLIRLACQYYGLEFDKVMNSNLADFYMVENGDNMEINIPPFSDLSNSGIDYVTIRLLKTEWEILEDSEK